MNTHEHARLTFARRIEMVKQMTARGLSAPEADIAHGMTAPTARKWLGYYLPAVKLRWLMRRPGSTLAPSGRACQGAAHRRAATPTHAVLAPRRECGRLLCLHGQSRAPACVPPLSRLGSPRNSLLTPHN